jgi:hypothetical protein
MDVEAPPRDLARVDAGGPPRRERPRLLVLVDCAVAAQPELAWALHEAARREGAVIAVALLETDAPQRRREALLTTLEAHALRATGETGVHGRLRTALLDPLVYEALAGTARGGDLVVVRPWAKTLLRPAVSRTAGRGRLVG